MKPCWGNKRYETKSCAAYSVGMDFGLDAKNKTSEPTHSGIDSEGLPQLA